MLTQYLSGLHWKESEFAGFYVVGDGHAAEYICAYHHKNNGSKKAICKIMDKDPGMFDFHHIIEDQHLADISGDGRLHEMYDYEMPTVLLHNLRHQLAYNAILHTREMRQVYLGTETRTTGSVEERQKEAVKLAQSAKGRGILKQRISVMKELYEQVYALDSTVRQIALNIFDHYLEKFD